MHERLEAAGVRHVAFESKGTAHEWQTWRRSLNDFAAPAVSGWNGGAPMNRPLATFALLLLSALAAPARAGQRTYCNPINVDYAYCPIPNFTRQGKHRTTADPVIVLFKGDYYLFSTNQWGYWWSEDLLAWHFVPRKFLKARAQGLRRAVRPGGVGDGGCSLPDRLDAHQGLPDLGQQQPADGRLDRGGAEVRRGGVGPGVLPRRRRPAVLVLRLEQHLSRSTAVEVDRKALQPVGQQPRADPAARRRARVGALRRAPGQHLPPRRSSKGRG